MIDSVSMFSDMALLENQEATGSTQGDTPSEIEDAARQFEAMLLQIVIKEMRKTVPEGMFSSSGGEIFQELFDQELSNEMLGSGQGLGLAQSLAGGQSRIPQSSSQVPLGLQAYASQGESRAVGETVYPVEGRVSSVFGKRKDPINGSHRHHNGLDIAAPEGTAIQSVRDGVVSFSGDRGGYGNLVIVDHGDGLETRYAHCAELRVEEGQRVQSGDTIATVGSTGRSTGPHLHLEARKEGAPVDPVHLFGW